MSLASFALLLGVACYVVGLPILLAEKPTLAYLKKLVKDDVALPIIGLVYVCLGALALKNQWHLTYDADGIVVFFAWMLVIKGLILAWQTKRYTKWANTLLNQQGMDLLYGFVAVVAGAFFMYLGCVLV